MNSLRKIILILFLLTYFGSRVSAILYCLKNIYTDFGFGAVSPHYGREAWPMKAFWKFDIRDMTTEHGQGYFDHLHNMMMVKEDMQLPGQFCETHAKGQDELQRQDQIQTPYILLLCTDELKEKFLFSNTKLDVLKDAYWRHKETDFISLNPDGSMSYLSEKFLIKINNHGVTKVSELMLKNRDGSNNYRYMYFYHLSQNFQYSQTERKLPYTPKDYCQIDKRIKENEKRNIFIDSFHESGEGSMPAGSSQDLFQ